MSSPATSPPLLLALSGPSSSGKTTLARLLRRIFPSVLILHQDDFYLPETQLPFRGGLRDWDCAAAIDVPGFVSALKHVKRTGELPEGLVSKEDRNSVGETGVGEEMVGRLRGDVGDWVGRERRRGRRLVVVDGFLLLAESVRSVRECFDVRLLLRATYAKAKGRREARSGYATLEGFWQDPPGYVDKVVWPNYVEEHGFLFGGGDVDGDVDEQAVRRLGIEVVPGNGDWDMQEMLEWTVERVKEALDGENR